MKIIPMILSFVIGRLNSKPTKGLREAALEIFGEITYRSRSVVTLILGSLGAVIILCGGFFIAVLDATTQFDRTGSIAWTATLGTGVVLVALAGLAFSFAFIKAWPRATLSARRETSHHPTSAETSPLETALATLVMDFVKEREASRTARTQAHPAGRPAEPSRPKKEDPVSHVH